MLKVLDLRGSGSDFSDRLPRPDLGAPGPVDEVRAIIAQVRERGDEALREYTERFDGVKLGDLRVPAQEMAGAVGRLPVELVSALRAASESVYGFHRHRSAHWDSYERQGISIRHLEIPVRRAGAYVPGGRALYPSSVLMTAIPPKVAGVEAVVVCVPPGPGGAVADEILAAAHIAGVDELYCVGGPQAIAAMAYGTDSIEAVDVIVGAGSRYVSIAKQEVRGVVGVPAAFAGPSEVVVIADDTIPPACAAIDVIVQAEHGPDGLAWLVSWSEAALREINAEIGRMVAVAARRSEIESTLNSGGYAVLVDDEAQAMAVANEIAPEHLELCCADPESLVPLIRNAGAVFLGPYSPASLGDYIAGPSHVLPTFRSARFSSVLGVEDFVRRVHVIKADAAGLAVVAPHVEAIARAEGLLAHAESMSVRTRPAPA